MPINLLAPVLLLSAAAGQPVQVSEAEARRVHRSLLLIDSHNDTPNWTVKGFDISKRSTEGHTDLVRLREGGVGAVFFAVYVGSQFAANKTAAHRALEMFDTVRRDIVGRCPGDFQQAFTADGILAARKAGKIAALMGVEGGHAIEDSLRLLRDFFDLGARYMTLTHVNTNNWADSSGDLNRAEVKHHNGLTAFGREVIGEMNRLGMMVDISHVSDKTFWDVLETSRAPVFASHSSCRALSNIPRNMTDRMIAAMAAKGGVIQINFGCEFLSQKSADASPWANPAIARRLIGLPQAERDRQELEYYAKMPRATVADVVAHIEHAVKVAGIGAVGIGTDYNGIECPPAGLEDVGKFPRLTRALLDRGYTADQIAELYGGNMLRFMRAVEKSAAK